MKGGLVQFFNSGNAAGGPPPGPTVILSEPFGSLGVDPAPSPNTYGFGGGCYYFPVGWSGNGKNDLMYVIQPSIQGYPDCDVVSSSAGVSLYMSPYFNYGWRYMQTGSISTLGKTSITLTFNHFDAVGTDATSATLLKVEYSVDNVTWNNVTVPFADVSGTVAWQAVPAMPLPLADNQATVWVRFSYNDTGSGRETFLDDITITGL